MKRKPFKFSSNYIAVALLVGAFAYSTFRVVRISFQQRDDEGADFGHHVVRIAHWQLEPGFRDAMQWAIDQYNALPKVRAANVRVEQLPLSEKIYNQFMNTQLIAGTAPDIAEKGMTRLIQGNAIAKFFAPLSDYVSEPNPYNAPDLLQKDLPPTFREDLSKMPWRQTFIDGMISGYDNNLQDYYAVPISVWGSVRLHYNIDIVRRIKTWLAQQVALDPRPHWLDFVQNKTDGDKRSGYLDLDSDTFRSWLAVPSQPPQTLGQLLSISEALLAYNLTHPESDLVAISASNQPQTALFPLYAAGFFTHFWHRLIFFDQLDIGTLQTGSGWEQGTWSFDQPVVREAYVLAQTFGRYLPKGYSGLDREQAFRRFVLGKAMIISTGAWDFESIRKSILDDEGEPRFEMNVQPPPAPGIGERWADEFRGFGSEAAFGTGAPMAINKQSKNFPWAIDFLRFLSSSRINEELNQRAGWMPAVIGSQPLDIMIPFLPNPNGVFMGGSFSFADGALRVIYSGQLKLLISGDATYDEFAEAINAFYALPRHGVHRMWRDSAEKSRQNSKSVEQSIAAASVRALGGDARTSNTLPNLLLNSATEDSSLELRIKWKQLNPGEPYPE